MDISKCDQTNCFPIFMTNNLYILNIFMNIFRFVNIYLLFWTIFKVIRVYKLKETMLNVMINQESSTCEQATNPNELSLKKCQTLKICIYNVSFLPFYSLIFVISSTYNILSYLCEDF